MRQEAGIVYAKIESADIGEIKIKHETNEEANDWVYNRIIDVDEENLDEYYQKMLEPADGMSLKMGLEETCGDGFRDEKDFFVVLEKEEMQEFANKMMEYAKKYPELKNKKDS